MGFSVTLRKVRHQTAQTLYQVTSMDRPGLFKRRPQYTSDQMVMESPPEGRRGYFPVGVDTKTPGWFQDKGNK